MSTSEDVNESEWLENTRIRKILEKHLDETDYQIFKALNDDGRLSDTDLGERIGLSRTAARRRRKNLQKNGVIDVLAVIVLQEADFAYADVRAKFAADASQEEIETFIETLMAEELIYEVDEYMGQYDLLVRAWHADLNVLTTLIRELFQSEVCIESYETTPVTKTRKAWNKVINGVASDD